MSVHLEPSFPAHLGDQSPLPAECFGQKETHRDSYQLPSDQVSSGPPAPTPALLVTQQAPTLCTQTPRVKVTVWRGG